MPQCVASITEDSRGAIYYCNAYIIQATNGCSTWLSYTSPKNIPMCKHSSLYFPAVSEVDKHFHRLWSELWCGRSWWGRTWGAPSPSRPSCWDESGGSPEKKMVSWNWVFLRMEWPTEVQLFPEFLEQADRKSSRSPKWWWHVLSQITTDSLEHRQLSITLKLNVPEWIL